MWSDNELFAQQIVETHLQAEISRLVRELACTKGYSPAQVKARTMLSPKCDQIAVYEIYLVGNLLREALREAGENTQEDFLGHATWSRTRCMPAHQDPVILSIAETWLTKRTQEARQRLQALMATQPREMAASPS